MHSEAFAPTRPAHVHKTFLVGGAGYRSPHTSWLHAETLLGVELCNITPRLEGFRARMQMRVRERVINPSRCGVM